ncbi:unnamed protein product [Echinostoma caproni]|uniref:Ovule protein n=1 Tax=Echinostoma caproni TaxID=27848 RepID=A0A183AG42_9TREM|nr:unnamed protein product [Echinostoma caproni]
MDTEITGPRLNEGNGFVVKSRKKAHDVLLPQKPGDKGRLKYPMKWMLRSSKSEGLMDCDGISSSSQTDSKSRQTSSLALNTNGLKSPRYAKLANVTSSDQIHSHTPSIVANAQRKKKLVSSKWNDLANVLR